MKTRFAYIREFRVLCPVAVCQLVLLLMAGTGCEVDSFIDPSVVGRWEYTPTVVPILERIDVIERDSGEFVETTHVMPEDLVPLIGDYFVGPADGIVIEIFDFIQPGVSTPFERIVNAQGDINLPQLGRINVLGSSPEQIQEQIKTRLRDAGIIADALVSVQVLERRDATYSVFGAVQRPGRYTIAEPDYRLLEATTEAGGISPGTRNVFVIRQTALVDTVIGAQRTDPQQPDQPTAPAQDGIDINELIDELTGDGGAQASFQPSNVPPATNTIQKSRNTPVDLPDTSRQTSESDRWIFVDDQWVRVGQMGLPESSDPLANAAGALVTQRVIKVPVGPLVAGDARYNVVIRPGDIINVPGPPQGFVYLAGPGIARPGVYSLPAIGRMTLTKAIMSAGGLSAVAIPSRVDLTRMVGEDRQATIRLNLRAIAEGTHPDVFLKADDMVNVGTNFWAQPLAIVRNGFRFTYGFGFLIDRNFGNDVYGPPPVNRGF